MTKKIGSSLASWKSAALLALVAMLAAVAFSGVLTTQTADAEVGSFSLTAVFEDAVTDRATTDGDNLVITITAKGDENDTWSYSVDYPAATGVTDVACAAGAVVTAAGEGATELSAVIIAGLATTDDATDDVSIDGKYTVRVATGDCDTSGTAAAFADEATVFAAQSITVSAPSSLIAANPGVSKLVTFAVTGDTPQTFRISSDSSGKGVFGANDRASIACTDGQACDLNDASGVISLRVNVAEDSGPGPIYVQLYTRSGGNFEVDDADEKTINVSAGVPVSRIAVTPGDGAISATDGSTTVTITAYDGKGNKLGGRTASIVTTNGLVSGGGNDSTCGDSGVLGCTVKTAITGADKGTAKVDLKGANRPGKATITVIVEGQTKTADVTLYGSPTSISAAIDESSLELGDSTFIVVKITDSAGNGVADVEPIVAGGRNAPAGPDASSVPVAAVANADKLKPGKERGEDRVVADVATPGCEYGTNAKGECVIEVTATLTPDPSKNATRGTHTVTVEGPEEIKAADRQQSVTVVVAGQPDSMSNNAPQRVEPLTETKVTVTVLDDAGERVGAVKFQVVLVEGEGRVLNPSPTSTKNGEASFTYFSPTRSGVATFFISAGEALPGKNRITGQLTINIGPAPVEAPEAPPATWNNALVSGQNVVVWNGPDGADPSEGDAEGVTAIWWYNNGAARWDGYYPDAADVPGGNTLTSLSNGQAYVVIVN